MNENRTGDMATTAIKCPHCGEFDWRRAPGLRDTLQFFRGRGRLTTRDVADRFGISVQNASNRMAKLEGYGLVKRVDSRTATGGGLEYVFALTSQEESA